MKRNLTIHLSICFALLFFTFNATTLIAIDINWDKLFNGDIEVISANHSDGIPGLKLLMTVTASRERIWKTLTDYENFSDIFKGIDKLKVLKEDAKGADVEFWINAVVANYHYVLYRRYEKPLERLTWKRVSGDLERIEGSWEIRDTPRPKTKLLIYHSYVQAANAIPKSLLRWGAMRRARAMGQRLRQTLEAPATKDAISR